jgi:hypothetical protein
MRQKHLKYWAWPLLVVLILASLGLAAPPTRALSNPPVIATYHVLYDKHHWTYDAMSDRPVPLYQSSDGDAMNEHIQQASEMGIDAFLCEWHGPDIDATDERCRRLQERVAESGHAMQVGFLLTITPQSSNEILEIDNLVEVINELKTEVINQEGYLMLQGKPALFWQNPQYVADAEGWRRFRNQVDLNRDMTWVATTNVASFQDSLYGYLNVFDSVYLDDISRQPTPIIALAAHANALQSYNRTNRAEKPFIATVMPGFDDTRINPEGHLRDRQNGAYYRTAWAAAAQYRPAAVVLKSFNNFYQGTHIQTSEGYATQYPDLTRDLIAQFRSAVPSRSITTPANPNPPQYFAQTGHFLRGAFLSYWQSKGGASKFGYPITEEFIRKSDNKIVQYFERARFELRVENGVAHVDMGLIGTEYADLKDYVFEPVAAVPNTATRIYFPQTGHTLEGWFKVFWDSNGGLDFFGFPISEPFTEAFEDGTTRTVQYFQRARLEQHPGAVHMGILGPSLAPCHHLTARAADNPPAEPLPQGDDKRCSEIDESDPESDIVPDEPVPGMTRGPTAHGRVYPAVVQPGQIQGFEAWEYQPGEEVVLWLNKPDGGVRVISYRAIADDNGYVLIGFQTERTDPEGQWSLVGKGVQSDREVVAPFELRW